MTEPFTTVKEAAKKLLVSECTIRRYIRQGFLRASKVRRHFVISQEELTRLIEEGYQELEKEHDRKEV